GKHKSFVPIQREQETLWCLVEISMWGLADAYLSTGCARGLKQDIAKEQRKISKEVTLKPFGIPMAAAKVIAAKNHINFGSVTCICIAISQICLLFTR
ncbi:hypothetical protein DFP81_1211, partial [Marinomonas pollencensis]